MAEAPVRVLFVINQFLQGGSERYLFEICTALNRCRFDVQILTRRGVDRSGFYYERFIALGIPIHATRPHLPDIARFAPSVARSRWYRIGRNRLSSWLAHRRIRELLRSFDIIACIQVENFLSLQGAVRDHRGVVVHLMSNRFQYEYDPYEEIGLDRHHRFVTFDRSQTDEIRHCANAQVFQWPLSMDFTGYPEIPLPPSGQPLKIGIVTRLSREKPLGPLFRSFKEMLASVDATLHVYGGGDASIFSREIRSLDIGDRVIFEGHRENLLAMLASDGLSMCWLMSVDTLLGYATIELAASGMPMVFWNFGLWSTERIRQETGGAVHSFNSPAQFAEFCHQCLMNRASLTELGARLRRYILDMHDIHKNITDLENYYVRVADRTALAGGKSR